MATNPWTNFQYNGINRDNYLECDSTFIDEYKNFYRVWCQVQKGTNKGKPNSEKNKSELHLELFPEPFEGSPDAPIYLLGANPGYDEKDKDWCDATKPEGKIFLPLIRNNLSHSTPFVFFNEELEKHCGAKWWDSHIDKKLKDKIFNIEYFPYHSQKADGLKAFLDKKKNIHCRSEVYANDLIHQAMKENKCIIITRFEKYWFERITDLKKYEKLFILLDHQSANVKEGNVVKYDDFVNLKSNSWANIP